MSKHNVNLRTQCFVDTDFLLVGSLQNITISQNIFRGIRNLLDSYHVPELIKVQSRSDTIRIFQIKYLLLKFYH